MRNEKDNTKDNAMEKKKKKKTLDSDASLIFHVVFHCGK